MAFETPEQFEAEAVFGGSNKSKSAVDSVVMCDHIIGHYTSLHIGEGIVYASAAEEVEHCKKYNEGYQFTEFTFCPLCGERLST